MKAVDLAGAVLGLAVIGGALMDWNFQNSASQIAESHIITVATAAQCPGRSDALLSARRSAYAYSLTHPADLPPWRVFQAARIRTDIGMPDDMIAAMICNAIAANPS